MKKPLTRAEIEAAKARAEAATKGPWFAYESQGKHFGIAYQDHPASYAYDEAPDDGTAPLHLEAQYFDGKDTQRTWGIVNKEDADFIAAARTGVPALADTAIYWQERCERATELLQALKGRIFMNCKEVQQADAFLAEAQPEQKEAEG